MKIYFLLLLIILYSNLAFSQIPTGYYNGTEGLSGSDLKNALHNIIKDHTEYPYTSTATDVWDILKQTDKDPNNSDNVIFIHTGWSVNADQEYNEAKGWSREHVWAKSHGNFGTETGAGTDVHALRPCDISVNEARSNYDFANGGEIYIDEGNDNTSGATECKKTSNSWEPRDAVKGDIARMIFYMAVRYEGENNEPDLELVDNVNSSPNKEPFHGKVSDLLKWHINDPVDDWERNRNNIIYYDYQHNRNPFIDYPEFAEKIWSGVLGVNKLLKEVENIQIYPNPVKDTFFVNFYDNSLNPVEVKLIDITGKIIKSIKVTSKKLSISTNNLTKGIYFIKISFLNKPSYSKLIFVE